MISPAAIVTAFEDRARRVAVLLLRQAPAGVESELREQRAIARADAAGEPADRVRHRFRALTADEDVGLVEAGASLRQAIADVEGRLLLEPSRNEARSER